MQHVISTRAEEVDDGSAGTLLSQSGQFVHRIVIIGPPVQIGHGRHQGSDSVRGAVVPEMNGPLLILCSSLRPGQNMFIKEFNQLVTFQPRFTFYWLVEPEKNPPPR